MRETADFFYLVFGEGPAIIIKELLLFANEKVNFFLLKIVYIFFVTALFYYLFFVRLLSLRWHLKDCHDWYLNSMEDIKQIENE